MVPSPGQGQQHELKGERGTSPVISQVPIHHPQPQALLLPPWPGCLRHRPHACRTGGRLMGQVLVPRAGFSPDKVRAEIALGQYSALATWSCGWSHLRGTGGPGAGTAAVAQLSSLPVQGESPCSWMDPGPPPAICSPCPSAFPTQPSSWGKAKVPASPTVNNSRGITAFPFITLPPNPSCYLCVCPPRLSQCSAVPSLHPLLPQHPRVLAGEGFAPHQSSPEAPELGDKWHCWLHSDSAKGTCCWKNCATGYPQHFVV